MMREIMRVSGLATVLTIGLAGICTAGAPDEADTATAVKQPAAASLTVAAAHSLKPLFQEILPIFETEHGVTVQVLYGPSHTLRRQIEKGAPIDVFLPEEVEEVRKLQKKGLTLNGGAKIYAQTSLVLVMSTTSQAASVSFRDALPNQAIRVALVDPKTSAMGEVTVKALTKLDPASRNRSRLLHAQHSDDVMNLVSTGGADVGLVYRADAINSGQVRIIDEAPAGMDLPVQLGHAVVWTCRDSSRQVAEQFFGFIMSPRVQKLLLKYGFDSIPANG